MQQASRTAFCSTRRDITESSEFRGPLCPFQSTLVIKWRLQSDGARFEEDGTCWSLAGVASKACFTRRLRRPPRIGRVSRMKHAQTTRRSAAKSNRCWSTRTWRAVFSFPGSIASHLNLHRPERWNTGTLSAFPAPARKSVDRRYCGWPGRRPFAGLPRFETFGAVSRPSPMTPKGCSADQRRSPPSSKHVVPWSASRGRSAVVAHNNYRLYGLR